jgi:hypothetical protein
MGVRPQYRLQIQRGGWHYGGHTVHLWIPTERLQSTEATVAYNACAGREVSKPYDHSRCQEWSQKATAPECR